MIKGH